MREIKFRGKRIDNGEWVNGYYYTNELGNHFIKKTVDDESGTFVLEDYEIDYKTVGQYTGLKDKDGKEIYEGDILLEKNCKIWEEITRNDGSKWSRMTNKTEDILYRVYYDEKTCQFTTNRVWLWTLSNLTEVIGNIYEHPELLA